VAAQPLVVGSGELLFGDASDDPDPAHHEGVLVQGFARQLPLHSWKQDIVRKGQIRQVRQVVDHPDAVGGDERLGGRGSVHRRIIPVEKPLLAGLKGTIFPEFLLKTWPGI